MKDDDVPVSSTDELTVSGGRLADRVRKFGEYKQTNAPLSAAEIEIRKRLRDDTESPDEWEPKTAEEAIDLTPIPEKKPTEEEPPEAEPIELRNPDS